MTNVIFFAGHERVRAHKEGLLEMWGALGRSGFSCYASLCLLPPDTSVPVHVEATKSEFFFDDRIAKFAQVTVLSDNN